MKRQTELKVLKDDMVLRGFTRKTMAAYLFWNERFLRFIRKSPKIVTNADLKSFLLSLAERELNNNTLHLAVSALKFYYVNVLNRRFKLVYPKRPKNLPTVLTKGEIERMISLTNNRKHRILLMILYSSGLRVSELVKLKWQDIDFGRKVLLVRQGKGRKDRLTILSEKVVSELLPMPRNSGFLFYSGKNPEKHLSIRSAQMIIKAAAKKAGIEKNVFCHALRSSFATHLIEQGTDVSYVQKLLGHSRIQTTQGYLRVADKSLFAVKSPYD